MPLQPLQAFCRSITITRKPVPNIQVHSYDNPQRKFLYIYVYIYNTPQFRIQSHSPLPLSTRMIFDLKHPRPFPAGRLLQAVWRGKGEAPLEWDLGFKV